MTTDQDAATVRDALRPWVYDSQNDGDLAVQRNLAALDRLTARIAELEGELAFRADTAYVEFLEAEVQRLREALERAKKMRWDTWEELSDWFSDQGRAVPESLAYSALAALTPTEEPTRMPLKSEGGWAAEAMREELATCPTCGSVDPAFDLSKTAMELARHFSKRPTDRCPDPWHGEEPT